ncbi:MAG: DUF6089 family protein [Flavobacteriales bacterium]
MKPALLRTALVVAMAAAMGGSAKAQYDWDFGAHLGGANYLGEFGGKEKSRRDFIWDMQLGQTRWAVGAFARRKINRMVSVSSGVMYYRLQGGDYLSTNPERVGRNLSFRNDMVELYVRPELTLFQDNDIGGRGRYKTDFRLFGYIGGSVYYSDPKGQINHTGEFYALREQTTELQNYSSIGFAVPAGIGFHFTFKRKHRIGWDFGWRTTFSDYLDDASTVYADPSALPGGATGLAAQLASQSDFVRPPGSNIPDPIQYTAGLKRGDPTHNDSYLTMTLTYSYVLRGQSNFYRQRHSWTRGKKRIGRKSRAKF